VKQRLRPIVVGLGLLGLVSTPTFAAMTTQQAQAMQQQINSLQRQLDAAKVEGTTQTTARHSTIKHRASKSGKRDAVQNPAVPSDSSSHITGPNNLPTSGAKYLPIDVDVPGQSFVSTGPYLGVPLSFSGSNLIINTPNINEDVSLLKMRENINNRLKQLGVVKPEDHSHILLSGIVEGQAMYNNRGASANTSDIDLTSAELDAYILGPSSWTSGLLALAYDNDVGASSGVITTNNRVSNSRVFVNKAFITIGDFSQTPFYGSIGQMYVPFGTYSSSMIASPLTKTLARTKDRAILLGFQQQAPNAFYASGYAFKGDSYVGSTNRVDNGGVNVGYKFDSGKGVTGDIGGGWIRNIADSIGMQKTDNRPFFDGFGSTSMTCGAAGTSACGNEVLVHRVGAYDVRGTLDVGDHWDFLAEYITASTKFNPNDMTFNASGARPSALNAEAAYSFMTFGNKPTSIAVGYGMTREALAIGLPKTRYVAALNTSWWRNTLQSLEFRHDINYSASSTATGSNVAAANGTGKADNIVTAQFDIYF
jgi:hypothetical protein